jgi:hypothetical protein
MAGSATAGSASTAIEESSFFSNGTASELRVAVVTLGYLWIEEMDRAQRVIGSRAIHEVGCESR